MAVRTEGEDAPWIVRVTVVDPEKNKIDMIWIDGKYNGQWKLGGQNEKGKI